MASRLVMDPSSGAMVTLHELARRHDIHYSTVRRRYWKGLRGYALVEMSSSWREWNGRELKLLDEHYRAGTPVDEIAELVGHTVPAVKRRAQERELVHPGRSSAQAVRNFVEAESRPLEEIAQAYRDRRLSRSDLAGAIGISYQTLRRFLPAELWQSWPRMTIGRIDAARQRATSNARNAA